MQTHILSDMIKLVQTASTHPQDGAPSNVKGELPTLDFLTELGQLPPETLPNKGIEGIQPKIPLNTGSLTSQTVVFTQSASTEPDKFVSTYETLPIVTQPIERTPNALSGVANTAALASIPSEMLPGKVSSVDVTIAAVKIANSGETKVELPHQNLNTDVVPPTKAAPLTANDTPSEIERAFVPTAGLDSQQAKPAHLPENTVISQANPQEITEPSTKQQSVVAAPIIPNRIQEQNRTDIELNRVQSHATAQPYASAFPALEPTMPVPAIDQKSAPAPTVAKTLVERASPVVDEKQPQAMQVAKPADQQQPNTNAPSERTTFLSQTLGNPALVSNERTAPHSTAGGETNLQTSNSVENLDVAAPAAKAQELYATPKSPTEAVVRQTQNTAGPNMVEPDLNTPSADVAKTPDRQAPLVLPSSVQANAYAHSTPAASLVAARNSIEIDRPKSGKAIQADPLPSSSAMETPKLTAPTQNSAAPIPQVANSPMSALAVTTPDPKSDPTDDAVLELPTATQTQSAPRDIIRGPAELPMARHVATQITDAARALPNGPVEIALNPEELGRVRLSLSTNDGGISLVVTAERADTAELLRRNMDSLGQEFRDLGYEDISFSFSGDGSDQNANTDEQSTDSGSRNLASNTDTPTPEPTRITLGTGVDIRL